MLFDSKEDPTSNLPDLLSSFKGADSRYLATSTLPTSGTK